MIIFGEWFHRNGEGSASAEDNLGFPKSLEDNSRRMSFPSNRALGPHRNTSETYVTRLMTDAIESGKIVAQYEE